jgi:two-component sensor histidine kinase/predicted  nucleic acid-binding Zn-ribbon protein
MENIMDISTTENLKTVRDSNQEMLDYFNGLYVAKLEQIQSLKTEQFELKIKIDELMKTLEVYSFKNSAGHNVFSPFSTTTTTQEEKAAQIEQELKELNASDAELTANIHSLQADADELKSRITLLHTATRKLDTFLDELADEFTKESTALEDDESTEENLPVINHGFNILRLKKYDQDKLVQTLHTDILDQLDRTRHTLDSLSWLIKSDINRATVTLDELIERTISMKDSLNAILSGLTGGIDTSVPIETLLRDTIFRYKDTHPECVIESDIDCPDASIEIPEIITISLIRILCECLDNVYKHANANRVGINIQIYSDQISVHINDNGIGIDENYSHTSPWNSGLHRIQEIIYLLNGQLKIEGDIISGTDIRFSIPIEIM